MNKEGQIGVLGAGVMGSVLVKSLVKLVSVKNVLVCDTNSVKLKILQKEFSGLKVTEKISDLVSRKIIFLAIKPQDFFQLKLKMPLALIVSIMAGVKIQAIKKRLGARKVIRAMPNTPARLAKGFIAWTATLSVDSQLRQWVQKLWQTMGKEIYFDKEIMVDKATAVTGSGPAYLFYNFQCFVKAAEKIGFTRQQSLRMVLSVFDGSLSLLKENNDYQSLVKQVASKGGTTEAALRQFKKLSLEKIWLQAVKAAYQRSRELNQ